MFIVGSVELNKGLKSMIRIGLILFIVKKLREGGGFHCTKIKIKKAPSSLEFLRLIKQVDLFGQKIIS